MKRYIHHMTRAGIIALSVIAALSAHAGNSVAGSYSAVGSGDGNTIIGGGYSFIGGGLSNNLTGFFSNIGGGKLNVAKPYTYIGGGEKNVTYSFYDVIGGGYANVASDQFSTVAGGGKNQATGAGAFVGGGGWNGTSAAGNIASGIGATVGGGFGNVAGGQYSVVPGGYHNSALGGACFAGGSNATAAHDGAFVWNATSSADFEFTVGAPGGVRFLTSYDATTGVVLAPNDNQWSVLSDRNAKEAFTPLDLRALLDKVDHMPVTEWSLKAQGPSVRDIGPMAQDFKAAFGLGTDDKHIGTADANGVALAGIQGLYRLVKEKSAEIDGLQERHTELEDRLSKLESLAHQISERLDRDGTARPTR